MRQGSFSSAFSDTYSLVTPTLLRHSSLFYDTYPFKRGFRDERGIAVTSDTMVALWTATRFYKIPKMILQYLPM